MEKRPIVTVTIITLCLVTFCLQVLSFKFYGREVMIGIFAKDNASIIGGEVWRLVTALFLHGNYVHLLLNLPWVVGRMMESPMDRSKYVVLCLGSGLCSTITSFAFAPQLMIGSSGIVFGLWGAMILAIYRSDWQQKITVVLVNIALLIISLALAFSLPFDNYAHIGGLLFGIVYEGWFCKADLF